MIGDTADFAITLKVCIDGGEGSYWEYSYYVKQAKRDIVGDIVL